jgi:hypothetical protein
MKASKLISTVLAAVAVAGGISVAVAQNAMPQTPAQDTGTKKDIEATGAMSPMSPAPAPAAASSPATTTDNSSNMSTTTEPAAQPTRG